MAGPKPLLTEHSSQIGELCQVNVLTGLNDVYEYGDNGSGNFDHQLSVVKELFDVGQDSQGIAQKLLSDENCLVLL